jgi:hypothetical protein
MGSTHRADICVGWISNPDNGVGSIYGKQDLSVFNTMQDRSLDPFFTDANQKSEEEYNT